MKRKNGFTLIEFLVVMAIIAILASILLPALDRAKKRHAAIEAAQASTNQVQKIAEPPIPHPETFGHGIYYFHEVDMEFPKNLSAFMGLHPEFKVLAIAPNVIRQNYYEQNYYNMNSRTTHYADHGVIVGYTVVFEEPRTNTLAELPR